LLLALVASPLLAAAPVPPIDHNTLYILVLSEHASVSAFNSSAPERIDYARRLGLSNSELVKLNQIANAFVTADARLRVEAGHFHATAKKTLDAEFAGRVRSFTARRESLAANAANALKAQLTSTSYAAFEQYIQTTFRQSVSIVTNDNAQSPSH
jgi:hypothetical protein